MNREQKSVAIAEIATQIDKSDAIFAVDYRGISVSQAAELRARLRDADAVFKVVKNSLTERAADQAGAESLKTYLTGPTALTFVRGDVAMAAKAIADFGRASQLLPFKGGLMEGDVLEVEQIRALSRLPSREVLYGQLVGVVASPVSGLVRTLNALLSGLAVALGGVREKKESGEVPAGEAPAAESEEPTVQDAAPAEAVVPAAEDETPPAEAEEATAPGETPPAEDEAPDAEAAGEDQAGPEQPEPAQEEDKQADASAEDQPEDAEANPTKED